MSSGQTLSPVSPRWFLTSLRFWPHRHLDKSVGCCCISLETGCRLCSQSVSIVMDLFTWWEDFIQTLLIDGTENNELQQTLPERSIYPVFLRSGALSSTTNSWMKLKGEHSSSLSGGFQRRHLDNYFHEIHCGFFGKEPNEWLQCHPQSESFTEYTARPYMVNYHKIWWAHRLLKG